MGMSEDERHDTDQAWAVEGAEPFLGRVEQLVTARPASLQSMRNLRELAILYEARAQFLVELKEQYEQALHPESGVTVPDREELLELLAAHEEEVRAEWDATEPVPDVTILEVLWPDKPPDEDSS
jgi:hypothetical protein